MEVQKEKRKGMMRHTPNSLREKRIMMESYNHDANKNDTVSMRMDMSGERCI